MVSHLDRYIHAANDAPSPFEAFCRLIRSQSMVSGILRSIDVEVPVRFRSENTQDMRQAVRDWLREVLPAGSRIDVPNGFQYEHKDAKGNLVPTIRIGVSPAVAQKIVDFQNHQDQERVLHTRFSR